MSGTMKKETHVHIIFMQYEKCLFSDCFRAFRCVDSVANETLYTLHASRMDFFFCF